MWNWNHQKKEKTWGERKYLRKQGQSIFKSGAIPQIQESPQN